MPHVVSGTLSHPASVAWKQPHGLVSTWAWQCSNKILFVDTEMWTPYNSFSCVVKYIIWYFGTSWKLLVLFAHGRDVLDSTWKWWFAPLCSRPHWKDLDVWGRKSGIRILSLSFSPQIWDSARLGSIWVSAVQCVIVLNSRSLTVTAIMKRLNSVSCSALFVGIGSGICSVLFFRWSLTPYWLPCLNR